MAEALKAVQDQDDPLPLGQGGHRLRHRLLALLPKQLIPGSIRVCRHLGIRQLGQSRALGVVQAQVHHDPVEPRRERRRRLVAVGRAPEAQERLLRHVVGDIPSAGEAKGDGPDPLLVALHQIGQGLSVPVRHGRHQLSVAGRELSRLLDAFNHNGSGVQVRSYHQFCNQRTKLSAGKQSLPRSDIEAVKAPWLFLVSGLSIFLWPLLMKEIVMERMKRLVTAASVAAMLLGLGVSGASAADRQRKQDRKRDGSCTVQSVRQADRKQDRKRDGSCIKSASAQQDRKQDRKRDGSCR